MANNPRPALYYTIKRGYGDFDVMRVTSLKASRIYGSVEGISTHAIPRQLYGNFSTYEAAAKMLDVVRDQYRIMSEPVKEAERALSRAHNAREAGVTAILKGINANA